MFIYYMSTTPLETRPASKAYGRVAGHRIAPVGLITIRSMDRDGVGGNLSPSGIDQHRRNDRDNHEGSSSTHKRRAIAEDQYITGRSLHIAITGLARDRAHQVYQAACSP